jgi:hypothetical protein
MPDPILLLFIIFHAWDAITYAYIWWKGTDPDKKTFAKEEVSEDRRAPALVA